ncbi:hypothetical protein D3C75_1053690 [compost metagenome]
MTEERKAAGTNRKTSATVKVKGTVTPMVGTEQVVRQREDRARASKPKRPDTVSAFDAYIMREGTEG